MPITIGSNVASLSAQRRLADGTSQLSKTFERLSSGQRINKAADDAAGLAIAESLNSDRRVFNQGVRNFNDGISLLNIADGALQSLSDITIRLKELAEQSANGTYSITQRKAIDKEAQALSKEYTRIVHSTKFNGVHLLNGSLGSGVRVQGGYGIDGSILAGVGGAIGNGSFGSSASFQGYSSSIAVGDINGDGNLDYVSGGSSGGARLGVMLGNGSGSFSGFTSYSLGAGDVSDLELADLNNDGILDITSINQGAIFVSLGQGNGTFGSASSFSDGGTLYSLKLGDLNGDGVQDVFTTGYSSFGFSSYRLGNGDGTFGNATTYVTGTYPALSNDIGDINGDGVMDLVSSGYSGSGGPQIFIRTGRGNGTFNSVYTYGVTSGAAEAPRSVKLGDLNNDGILDLTSLNADGTLNVRIGNGNGNFGSESNYSMAFASQGELALGDLNGDGHLDLLGSGSSGGGRVAVRLGNGNGTFGNVTSYLMNSTDTLDFILGDFNTDGVIDILTAGTAAGNTLRLADTLNGASPLLPFSLSSSSGARQALPVFDQKIQQLAKQRGQIGAFQSRIQVGINNLQAASENYAAAESRIKDADIAEESSKLLRLNILQQAASSVLSQANQQPGLALRLLRS